MSLVLFIAFALCLFLLPLIPGLLELSSASDAKPLKVVQEYDSDVRHFAQGFKTYFEKNFGGFFNSMPEHDSAFEGTLEDNTMFQITNNSGVPFFTGEEVRNAATAKLIVSPVAMLLPGKMFFESEIYGKSTVKVGEHSQLRALLAEGDIMLGEGCTVLRWIHSNTSLYAAPGCNLLSRASADQTINISTGCHFERLNAHKIVFGAISAPRNTLNKGDLVTLETLPNVKDHFERRWLIDGDLSIPANSFFDGDIVASGNVVIGPGSYIRGSVKSNKDTHVFADARIDGSIFSSKNILVEPGCHISGPVIAEDAITLQEGSTIGVEILPTTVSAPVIHVASGVTTYGTVWADETGTVAA